MINLRPLRKFHYPITAECINPGLFEGKTGSEIGRLKIWEGNKQRFLAELFQVKEKKTEQSSITVYGNVERVRWIGAGMDKGEIVIQGDAGMHLGAAMIGGRIIVKGNVEAWAGSSMKGGTIEIHGNVGDYLSAPHRGFDKGMRGGRITVYGNVRNEAGAHMSNGLIKVYGCAGQFTGSRMQDGTIYVEKDVGVRAGASMTGGKIVVGGLLESVLPTFLIESVRSKAKIEQDEVVEGSFYVFVGDLVEHGDGKLYVRKEKNPQLSHYEKFLWGGSQ